MERDESPDVTPMIAAESEALYRRVNERIRELSGGSMLARDLFVCECGDPSCSLGLDLTTTEYELVRADPSHFVIAVGHEDLRIESVVSRNDRYVVVAKIGAVRDLAVSTDPRGRRD